jgi:hypothetical protein
MLTGDNRRSPAMPLWAQFSEGGAATPVCDGVASSRLPVILDLEEPPPHGPTHGAIRRACADSDNVARRPRLVPRKSRGDQHPVEFSGRMFREWFTKGWKGSDER